MVLKEINFLKIILSNFYCMYVCMLYVLPKHYYNLLAASIQVTELRYNVCMYVAVKGVGNLFSSTEAFCGCKRIYLGDLPRRYD